MLNTEKLECGDIVQLSPDVMNKGFALCLMVVTEIKSFGAQGYVQSLGTRDQPGGEAFIRINWKDIEPTGGKAVWMHE